MKTGRTETIKRRVRRWRITRIAVAGSLTAAGLLFVTAQAAGASWLELNTPAPPGASTWLFTAVSCTSPQVCMAVGSSSGGTNQLLAENRTSTGWHIRSIPQPAAGSALLGIWCTFSYSCTAVGDAPSGLSTVPLAERWNGSSWRIQKTPAPAGATGSQLTAVTCATALDCTAVGAVSTSPNSEIPLVEHWNGQKWKIEKAPTKSGFTESALSGVSCTSAARCIAVGSSFKPSPFTTVSLAELWNGSKWVIQKTPNPASGGPLNAVACLSRTDCLAVGDGFGARWNGTKWSLVKLGSPGSPANLSSISCAARACYADGTFFQEGVQTAVIEFWNGSRWRVQNPNITASAESTAFTSISCTTAVNCTAVGSYLDAVDGTRALADDFSLRWQDVAPLPTATDQPGFSTVSCPSPNSCVAVGTFFNGSGYETFSATWDGTFWTEQLPAKPKISTLEAVACRSATLCIAVGDVLSGGVPVPLAERWNGTGWSIEKAATPAGASRSFLTALSCPSKSACTAVGWYDHGSAQVALAEHWNGKTWTIQHTPDPAKKSSIALNGVSCVSANACEAAGSTSSGSFAEGWDGKSWQLQATPLQQGRTGGYLGGISCSRANSCFAVGDDVNGTRVVPTDDVWNGKTWQPHQAKIPPRAGTSGLTGVWCFNGRSCEAIGFETTSKTNAIAEKWDGRSWKLQAVQRPFGELQTGLSSLWCNSPSACMAVGFYLDGSSNTQILAEQFS